jgi:hypothetical protein
MSDGGLFLYFLSDPALGDDSTGALKDEAEIVRNYIPVRNPADLVWRAVIEFNRTGYKIKRMVISGHGTRYAMQIGDTWINLDNRLKWAPQLAMLRPYFSENASVYLFGCRVGQNSDLLMTLSALWGGVRVEAMTGDIMSGSWGPFGGFLYEGEKRVCIYTFCYFNNIDKDPRSTEEETRRARLFARACHGRNL